MKKMMKKQNEYFFGQRSLIRSFVDDDANNNRTSNGKTKKKRSGMVTGVIFLRHLPASKQLPIVIFVGVVCFIYLFIFLLRQSFVDSQINFRRQCERGKKTAKSKLIRTKPHSHSRAK